MEKEKKKYEEKIGWKEIGKAGEEDNRFEGKTDFRFFIVIKRLCKLQ